MECAGRAGGWVRKRESSKKKRREEGLTVGWK